jgi:hypothetical protein
MTDGEAFDEATATVVNFLSVFAEDVEPYDIERADDDNPARRRIVHVEEPVGPDYTVFATEGERTFRLQATYRLWADVADELSEADVSEHVPSTVAESHPVHSVVPGLEQFDETERDRLTAAVELLDSLPSESRRDLILQLTGVFTRAGLKHSVDAVGREAGLLGSLCSTDCFRTRTTSLSPNSTTPSNGFGWLHTWENFC